jgi:secernin
MLGKNSDRPVFDCQPLMFNGRKTWPAGSTINLGRITIPQVGATYATLGSSPYWCWGYEEGINEHGVAIGNEGIWTKVLTGNLSAHVENHGPDLGPTGMDLLRLGLERGKTARAALNVITSLVERYGQFGSGIPNAAAVVGAYENSYIIADASEAWVLETAGTHWIAKRVGEGTTSISNTLSLTTTWDRASAGLARYAVDRGWWPQEKIDAFDFTQAYHEVGPEQTARRQRALQRANCSARLLRERQGRITKRWMMNIARDRSSTPSIDLDQTASSCVAILPNQPDLLPVFWWCPSTPSSSCYIPFFVHGSALPAVVSTAGTYGKRTQAPSQAEVDTFSEQSFWWLFRDLVDKTNRDWKRRNQVVRSEFDALENEFAEGVPGVVQKAVELRASGQPEEAARALDAYSAACVSKARERVNELRRRFESEELAATTEYEPYLGRYVATFKEQVITVVEQNGHLSLNVPAQGVLQLEPPDEMGKWHLTAAPQVAVSFERNDDGKIIVMRFHQSGFSFELLREGYIPRAEIDLKHVARYLGKYRSQLRGVDFELRIQNNRLAVDIPGQAIFELHSPGADGKRSFRAMPVISVTFAESPEGKVTSMTLYKPGQEEKLLRLDSSQGSRGGQRSTDALAARPAATTDPSESPRTADFVEWVKQSAVRLDSLDWSNTPPAAFAFLDDALEGKRVVFLGELDHFVAERMEFRLLLIRELARRGFRRVGMEMGLSDGKRMDRFLETGDEKWLDRVALYGYRGDMRKDRKDEIAGWTDDSHPEFTRTVIAEAKWFLRQLRKINEELPKDEPRITWFGYDLSFWPGGGYADAKELLAPHKETPLVRSIKERMARIPDEGRIDEAVRLEGLVNMLDANRDELVAMMGKADALELRRSLQRMADAFRFIDGLPGLENYDANVVAATLSQRERRMDQNFDEHLSEWPPDEKIILLGHALHLSKDSESIQTQNFGLMFKSIGTYLAGKVPGEIYGFWLHHDRGRHGLMHGNPTIQSFRSPADSVEHLLAKVHPILMLPLGSADPREAWLDVERTFSNSGAPAQAVLPQQVDCLFFIETANEPGKRRGSPRSLGQRPAQGSAGLEASSRP